MDRTRHPPTPTGGNPDRWPHTAWVRIPEMGNRALPEILMEDGKTVHNAFFDRDFEE